MMPRFSAETSPGLRPAWPIVAGLWLVVLVTVSVAGLTPLSTDRLAGSDDYMRFVRVFTWLDGAGWHDPVEPRLSPPQGGELSWSRAVDLPLAAVVRLLEPDFGRIEAAMWAATIVPALLLLAILAVAVTLARPLTGRTGAPVAALVVLLLPNLVSGILPGRVDHHGWQLLVVSVLLAALARMALMPRRAGPAILAGAAVALGLWIGGEAAPWLVLYNAVLAVLWIRRGKLFLPAGVTSAATLAAGSVMILPIAAPVGQWWAVACDQFSLAYLGLGVGTLAFWILVAAAGKYTASPRRRLAVAAVAAAVAGGGWTALFRQCLEGPYAAIDPRLATDWLPTIGEAQGLVDYATAAPGTALTLVWGPVIALITTIVVLSRRRGSPRRRRLWFALALAIAGALALASWQIRVMPFANLAATPVLAWLVVSTWRRTPARWSGRQRRLTAGMVLVLVGPLGALFGGLETRLASEDGSSLGGVARAGNCELGKVADLLNDPTGLGAAPLVLAAPVDAGAELLFRTRHSVIAAPYHRNAEAILAIQKLFTATNDEDARQVLEQYRADLILLCPNTAEMRLYRLRSSDKGLAVRLAAGGTAPDWAEPVSLPAQAGALLYRVHHF